jgi:hypothetical protein
MQKLQQTSQDTIHNIPVVPQSKVTDIEEVISRETSSEDPHSPMVKEIMRSHLSPIESKKRQHTSYD